MTTKKEQRRIKIKYRVRNKISGTAECPRLTVFRSNKQIYVQIINDETASTLVAASSLGMEAMPKKEQAAKVGEAIAKKALWDKFVKYYLEAYDIALSKVNE